MHLPALPSAAGCQDLASVHYGMPALPPSSASETPMLLPCENTPGEGWSLMVTRLGGFKALTGKTVSY